jgi:hypothetical protein
MRVFDSLPELTLLVADWLAAEGPILLAVEGASLSGKTTLAGRIADRPDAIRMSTDCFRVAGRLGETYTEGLDLRYLRADVEKLRERFALVVIEGICLRDTVEAVGLAVDRWIYVKRLSHLGVWNDDPDLEVIEQPPDHGVGALIDWWSHEYHLRSRPHVKADVGFEWRE